MNCVETTALAGKSDDDDLRAFCSSLTPPLTPKSNRAGAISRLIVGRVYCLFNSPTRTIGDEFCLSTLLFFEKPRQAYPSRRVKATQVKSINQLNIRAADGEKIEILMAREVPGQFGHPTGLFFFSLPMATRWWPSETKGHLSKRRNRKRRATDAPLKRLSLIHHIDRPC